MNVLDDFNWESLATDVDTALLFLRFSNLITSISRSRSRIPAPAHSVDFSVHNQIG